MKFAANMVMELDATDDTTLDCDSSRRQIPRRSLRIIAFPFPCLVMGRKSCCRCAQMRSHWIWLIYRRPLKDPPAHIFVFRDESL